MNRDHTASPSEQQMLWESLPMDDVGDAYLEQVIAERLNKGADCPRLEVLFEAKRGGMSSALATHLAQCSYCQMRYGAVTRPWNREIAAAEYQRILDMQERVVVVVKTPVVETVSAEAMNWSPITRFFTKCEHGRKEEAIDDLRPLFPAALAAVGLDPQLHTEFEGFLRESALKADRSQPLLPQWLQKFAASTLDLTELPCEPSNQVWDAVFERVFLARTLKENWGSKGAEVERLRLSALERGVNRMKDLMRLALNLSIPQEIVDFFRDIVQEEKNRSLRRLGMTVT